MSCGLFFVRTSKIMSALMGIGPYYVGRSNHIYQGNENVILIVDIYERR